MQDKLNEIVKRLYCSHCEYLCTMWDVDCGVDKIVKDITKEITELFKPAKPVVDVIPDTDYMPTRYVIDGD